MITKTITKRECTRCGIKFWPKVDNKTDEEVVPKNCPGCNNRYWMKQVQKPTVAAAQREAHQLRKHNIKSKEKKKRT